MQSVPPFVVDPLLVAINHVIEQSGWASGRLCPHAGANVRLIVNDQLTATLGISASGIFQRGNEDCGADVTLAVRSDALVTLVTGDGDAVTAHVKLSGDADLAETLGFLVRNLRWDAEDDLAKLVGDAPAHRLVSLFEQGLRLQRDVAGRAVDNVREYLVEESPLLVARPELRKFLVDVSTLRDDVARLEKRLARIARYC